MSEQALHQLGKYHLDEGLAKAAESLRHYGPGNETWCIAYSGGKDSTCLATVVEWLFQTEQIERPKNCYLVRVDTTIELPPLHANSVNVSAALRKRGWKTICRSPKPRERLWVQMLGKGYPPANQRGNWWCTRSTKQAPQERMYAMLQQRHGRPLVLYGSRVHESNGRADRIANSCTAAGTECGLGLFIGKENHLAPLVGWRNCAVWDWLRLCHRKTGIDVTSLWEAYSAEDAEQPIFDWDSLSPDEQDRKAQEWDIQLDVEARTGCTNCHLVRADKALRRVSRTEAWGHLKPYQAIDAIVDSLRQHEHRVLRPSTGGAGALKLSSRLWALEQVLAIQAEVRQAAKDRGRPHWDIINPGDEELIRRMIAEETFPKGYSESPEDMPLVEKKRVLLPLIGQEEFSF